MALRIYLTQNNNEWGVKLNTNGSPAYEHFINFEPKNNQITWSQLRDDFVFKFLFDKDINWKDKVKTSLPKGDAEYDDNTILFDVDVLTEYPNEKWSTILNKNYAVIYDEETDSFSYWMVIGSTDDNHNIISFKGFRDWMFDLELSKLFNPNKQVVINRAHVDDVKDGLWNINQSSDNSIVEEIEEFSEECFSLKSQRDISNVNLSSVYDVNNTKPYSEFVKELDKGFSNYIFQPSIGKQGEGTNSVYITSIYNEQWTLYWISTVDNSDKAQEYKIKTYLNYGTNNDKAPYFSTLIPNSDLIRIKGDLISGESWINNTQFKTIFNGSPQLIKISPLPYTPLNLSSILSISYNTTDKVYEIYLKDNFNWNSGTNPNDNLIWFEAGLNLKYGKFKFQTLFKHLINGLDVKSDSIDINTAKDYDNNYLNKFILNNIAKLHKYPYQQIYLKNVSGSRMNVYNQLIKNNFNWNLGFTYAPDVWHLISMINDNDNQDGIYNSTFQYGLRLDDISPFTMPQESSAYLEYLTRNQDQINQQIRRISVNTGLGGISSAFGLGQLFHKPKQNPNLQTEIERNEAILNSKPSQLIFGTKRGATERASALQNLSNLAMKQGTKSIGMSLIGNTIIGGIGTIANSILDIQQQKAMLSDLKRNPSSISGNGGDVLGILPFTTMKPIEYTDELWPELKLSIGNYFHMFGSKLNSRFRNINDYLSTRWYFNYIETNDIYNNILPNINNGARAIINNSFTNGMWIWHYRNLSSVEWKGVKNFNVNNVQINLIKDILPSVVNVPLKNEIEEVQNEKITRKNTN